MGFRVWLYRGMVRDDRAMTSLRSPTSIVITGASSGIGAALALEYAEPGRTLLLTGRNAGRLDQQADLCRAKRAEVRTAVVDVTDRQAMADCLAEVEARAPVDLLIANAGISGGTSGAGEGEGQARAIFAANLDGMLNTVHPLVPRMVARRRGQIALMSSLAAFRGMPGAPAYCAAKAAVRIYGEGLRGELWQHGVTVSVICPGFVRSAMTAVNDFPMPLLMDADRAARIIRRGLARGRARIAFPWPNAVVAELIGALPPALTDALVRRLPKKAARG